MNVLVYASDVDAEWRRWLLEQGIELEEDELIVTEEETP